MKGKAMVGTCFWSHPVVDDAHADGTTVNPRAQLAAAPPVNLGPVGGIPLQPCLQECIDALHCTLHAALPLQGEETATKMHVTLLAKGHLECHMT